MFFGKRESDIKNKENIGIKTDEKVKFFVFDILCVKFMKNRFYLLLINFRICYTDYKG